MSRNRLINAPRMAANSYSPSAAPNTRSCRSSQTALFEKMPAQLLSSTFSQHRFHKDIDPFSHGLSWTSLEFLVKELASDSSRYFTPECLFSHPLSVELYPVRWSQRTFELSLSNVIASGKNLVPPRAGRTHPFFLL